MAKFIPKLVLIDLSGTVHVENELLHSASKAISLLKEKRIPFLFVTNTSKESKAMLLNRLEGLGIRLSDREVFTSLTATRKLLESKNLRPHLLLEHQALHDFKDMDMTEPNAVVVGLAPSMFNYEELTRAFNLIKSGAELIAVNKSRYFKRSQGLALGAGCFVTALEYATDKTATVVGKPTPDFFLQAIADFSDVTAEQCVMIGDDVRDDVAGAQAVGMKGILVKTGKYQENDEKKISPLPYRTLENILEAVQFLTDAG